MIKKRTFLLIEVLIGLWIICLCLVPLVSAPILSYRAEMQSLEEIERERLADLAFVEIKEKLLKNEIPWEKIPGPDTTSEIFSLPPVFIHLPQIPPKKIERKFQLHCGKKGEKEVQDGQIYRLLTVTVQFTPKLSRSRPSTYKIMVRKQPKASR